MCARGLHPPGEGLLISKPVEPDLGRDPADLDVGEPIGVAAVLVEGQRVAILQSAGVRSAELFAKPVDLVPLPLDVLKPRGLVLLQPLDLPVGISKLVVVAFFR